MTTQMQKNVVPLDFNNLGGADQNNYNNNNNNNYNNPNTMNGYPRGSYMNESNNNYNPDFANQTQRINNNYTQSNFNNFNGTNQQNMSNTLNNNNNYNQNLNNNTNMNMNQNYNLNNQQNNNNLDQNINTGMNEYVRRELSSHGLNNLRSPSPRQIRMEEQERKKMLLNNIQSQINLTKKTKLEELRKRQEEDAQYLKDMVVCFPFGRGGGGAPIRDKSGNIVTNRRALISDPKYNLAQINVDDDYYDVWDKEKRIGRYYRNGSQNNINNNNYNNNYNNNMNQQLSNTGQNFGGMNMNNNQNYFNDQNVGRPYSTNPRIMNNNNSNFNNGQIMDNYSQQNNNMNNNYSNNQQFFNTLQRPNQTISLTYDNFEVMDKDQLRQIKANYRQDLLNQMKENENKKLLEKKRKELEEAREEERLRKEREELELKEQEEKNKNQQLQNRVRNENNLLIIERNRNNNNNNNNQNQEFNNLRTINRTIRINEKNENNITDQEAIDKINQKEMESKMQLNNEILKLREQMKDQQNDLFNQIQFLKQETQSANQQRFEALKEIEKLKDELSKQRADETLRRKYVYDVIVNDTKEMNNVIQETHLPGNEKPEIVLPVHSEKDLFYDEKIRHPNRIIPVPKLTELHEHGVKTDSKFIDMDTHNIFSGLELYEPNNKLVDSQDEDYKINNRGIGLDGDYGTLRGYDNILKTSDVLLPNKSELNKNTVNISINNKNVRSFKNIKNVETNKDGRTENININLETEDDGNFEINRIYNKNLERLRFLNDMESVANSKNKDRDLITNNMLEKDNFDEFIKKLNRPAPTISKESDEFEIEISRLPK